MLTLKEIRKRYQDQWVLVDVTAEDELNQPTAGRVLAHDRDRKQVYERLGAIAPRDPLVFFTGEIPDDPVIIY